VPLRRTFLFAILFAAGLPVTMLLVPVYQLYVELGWLNSLLTTSLFLAATSLPFAIWLMKNFIDAVPSELEHAAELEGCGTLQTLVRVVLPLALPGVSVTAIYTFINAWGAFLVPLVLDSNPNDQPGPITIYNFMGSHGFFDFGELAAFSLMFSIPVIVLYLIMSRSFSGAFTFGGAIQG
jgi:multiple sugar transport system permease protein